MRDRETIARDVFIGWVDGDYAGYRNDSGRLYVDAEVYIREGEQQTVTHDTVTRSESPEISAGIRYRPHTDYSMCGQIRDALNHIVRYAPGWDAAKVRRLGEIWDGYHLADMRAGCIHQPKGTEVGEPCPVTGYKYGSAWLTQATPPEIISELRSLFEER